MSQPPPPDVQVLGDHVLLGPDVVLALEHLLRPWMEAAITAGRDVPPELRRLWAPLQRTAHGVTIAKAAERRLLAAPPAPADTVTTAEAAELLGVHERQVRRRADAGRYEARKWHGAWVLDRRLVELDAGVRRAAADASDVR